MGDDIVIPGVKNVECYSISTGAVKWTADIKNATNIITNEVTKEIYAFRTKGDNTVVYKINAENGASLWPEGNKIKGVISKIEFTDHGLAIVTNILGGGSKLASKLKGSGTSKVYLLDFNTGADLWDKSPKTKGIINHFYVEDDGIIFGVSDGGINKIAFDGTPRWKKPVLRFKSWPQCLPDYYIFQKLMLISLICKQVNRYLEKPLSTSVRKQLPQPMIKHGIVF